MFECPDCDEKFPTKHGRNSHRQRHSKPLTCDVCGRNDIKLMTVHRRNCKGPQPEPEVGEEISWETADHWQEFEAVKAENIQLKEALIEMTKDRNRLDVLRQRYLENWKAGKPYKGKR